jgi:hypothetical protein
MDGLSTAFYTYSVVFVCSFRSGIAAFDEVGSILKTGDIKINQWHENPSERSLNLWIKA